METGPRPEFVEKERDRVSNRINLITKMVFEKTSKTQCGRAALIKLRNSLLKDEDIPKLKMQLKTYEFLLSA